MSRPIGTYHSTFTDSRLDVSFQDISWPQRGTSEAWPPIRPISSALSDTEVHIWFTFLDHLLPRYQYFRCTLAPDELERSYRFHYAKDHEQYVIARGLLREILSSYTDVPPRELRFSYGPHGKPALITGALAEQVSFNLSHANQAAVYALTRSRKVGVDLEYVSGDLDVCELTRKVLSVRERCMLEGLPSGLRQRAFLACWARKEAYAKATGQGLSLDLQSLDVIAEDGQLPRLCAESDCSAKPHWSIADLCAPPGYVAALAIEGKVHQCRYGIW
jgi:4'-phosphopantetheinyl transferase